LPTPTKTGFSFVGWNTMANGSGTTYNDNTIYQQAGDITLYAIWSNTSYTLTYGADTGGTISGSSSQTVLYGQDGTAVEAVPSPDYVFDKWSDNSTDNPRQDTNVTHNISVTAHFIYNPFTCGNSQVTDSDGNIYDTVQIGNQCWFKENLKTTKYRDGVPINNITYAYTWIQYNDAGYVWYNNNSANKDIYGALYNRKAVSNPDHALCPAGWHVPSIYEFITLRDYIGLTNANALKATGTAYWDNNTGATNSSGFSARGAGRRNGNDEDAPFESLRQYTAFWTSTEGMPEEGMPTAHALYLTSTSTTINITLSSYSWNDSIHYQTPSNDLGIISASGLSVRCIKD